MAIMDPPDANATVLLVENDQAVRSSLCFALEVEGFAVHAFDTADALLREPGLPGCACLVADCDMPGIGGVELIARLRARGLQVPAILVTGHALPRTRRQAAGIGVPLLEKSAFGNDLVDQIRRSLRR